MKIAIIGAGKMGVWFAKFYQFKRLLCDTGRQEKRKNRQFKKRITS